ncbi:MAG: aKG-HExxH-type peptide beta-hydroxylase [Pseudonocardiaceae bacterium]
MSAALAGPLTELGGMPFVDDAFAARRLLAAAAAVRHVNAERRGMADGITDAEAEAWLAPARVFMLRHDSPSMPAAALVGGRRQRIADALAGLTSAIPPWTPLLRLPVRFALLYPSNGAISASSRSWPQHVLLSDEAFSSDTELREQLVHELCHQWLYLIEEVWTLEIVGARSAVLPSGTTGRTPSEVLGAAHVAAALIRLYSTVANELPGRLDHLARYGSGCVELLGRLKGDLTDVGLELAQHLKEIL